MAGPPGPFYVVPLLGALAVWLTYRLGHDWTNDRAAGVLAAALLAVSPIFLYQLMWPMTDVPVAAFWVAAFLAACHSRGPRPLAAGLAAGAAVLIRPNLLLIAVGLPAAWLWPAMRRSRRAARGGSAPATDAAPALAYSGAWRPTIQESALRRTAVANGAWYLLGLAPSVAVVAAIQLYLYGSPLTSGYGRLGDLYSTQNVWTNLGRYSTWLIETQTPLVGLSLVALAMKQTLREDDADRLSRRAAFCAVTALIAVSYLTFAVFDDWSSLRFFLPIFPPTLTLAAAASVRLLNKIWRPLRVPLALLIVIPFAAHEVRLAADRAVFKVKALERRYIESARQVANVTPPSAVILSVQHSGSVRYYAARQTLRYDELSPEWLDRAVAALKERGSRCYVLLDDWEEPGFRERFSRFTRLGRLDWRPIAEVAGPVHVRLFDLEAENPATSRAVDR
jgi:4-amino-4-deoxy-L-arabinose transferase-like glycosyltransferase